MPTTRRDFLRTAGVSAAALPFIGNLPSLGFANQGGRKQRLVVVFSPNGVVPGAFWPKAGPLTELPDILKPLDPVKKQTLVLHGVSDKILGDGDGHMRGIGCLLTGIELFPGNVQGGSDTPAGWSKGHSLDQELKTFLQKDAATRTRFGSAWSSACWCPIALTPGRGWCTQGPTSQLPPSTTRTRCSASSTAKPRIAHLLASVLDDLKPMTSRKWAQSLAPKIGRLLDEHAGFCPRDGGRTQGRPGPAGSGPCRARNRAGAETRER